MKIVTFIYGRNNQKNMENTMIPTTPSLLKGGIVPRGYGDGAGNGAPG
jgi:hypothetical protein